ncbi:DUF3383 family protein [Furfurilactobacillus sp. WILCCON 0119]
MSLLPQITDVNVVLTVSKPTAIEGLGIPAIFVKAEAPTAKPAFKKYSALDEMMADFDATTPTYQLAEAIFAQANAPTHVDVVTYVDLAAEATTYFFEDWHFALLATYNDADALILSNLIESQQYKFAVFQLETTDKFPDFGGNSRTVTYVHPAKLGRLDGAVIGNTANLVVGSTTWKFRHGLVGIQPNDAVLYSDYLAANKVHANMYVTRAGVASTTEGVTQSGDFIDALHGDDWVRSTVVSALQNAMIANAKIAYDQTGISVLRSQVELVLETAYRNGIIEQDDATGNGAYVVTAASRANETAAQLLKREYGGLTFTYNRAHAIHTVTVHGTIVDGQ